jgi:hypothetical protein
MRILLLLSLLSYPMLIGCGKKTESDGKSATGNDGEAVESTNGVSAETSASPENKLIGYWASDFKKTLENLKVLEANAPDDLLKEKYGRVIKSMTGELSRDLLPGALKQKFNIQIEKDGKIKAVVEGWEVGVGTYSIIDVKDTSSSWRVDAGLIGSSEGFSITLDGDTLQMSLPGGVTATGIPMLFSRTDKFIPKIRPKAEGVNYKKLEEREGIIYLKDSDTPYTGKAYEGDERWQEKEGNFKDGKQDGLFTAWHKNGQKAGEANFKDGKLVEGSKKFWNSKGEPVDSEEEANK